MSKSFSANYRNIVFGRSFKVDVNQICMKPSMILINYEVL